MFEQSVTVSAKEFTSFLKAIKGVYTGGASLVIHEDHIDTLVLSEDNASIMLYAKINRLDKGNKEEMTIHVKDVGKFNLLMSMDDKADSFTFIVKNNAIYFEGGKVSGAKFFLDENPARKIAKRITSDWFNAFKPHCTSTIQYTDIKNLLGCSRFASSSGKVYIYEKDGVIIAELNDKEKMNIDNISLKLVEKYDGHIEGNVIIALDSLSSIISGIDTLKMDVVTIVKHEALLFTVDLGGVLMKYLYTTKTK